MKEAILRELKRRKRHAQGKEIEKYSSTHHCSHEKRKLVFISVDSLTHTCCQRFQFPRKSSEGRSKVAIGPIKQDKSLVAHVKKTSSNIRC